MDDARPVAVDLLLHKMQQCNSRGHGRCFVATRSAIGNAFDLPLNRLG